MKILKAIGFVLGLVCLINLNSCDNKSWVTNWEIVNDSQDSIQAVVKQFPEAEDRLDQGGIIPPLGLINGSISTGNKERPDMNELYQFIQIFTIVDGGNELVLNFESEYYWELLDDNDDTQKVRFTYK